MITQPDVAPAREKAPDPGALRPFGFPPIHRFQLENGVPVLHARVEGLPVVTVSAIVRAGGAHEPPALAGLASLTASLLETGTAGRSGVEIAESLESLGVQLSTGPAWDYSFAEITTLTASARSGSEILAELVQRPDFKSEEVERLRNQQLAGVMQRRADPRALADEMASRFIFSADSPYSRALGGDARSLRAVDRERVVGFHHEGYAPGRTFLVIAGEVDEEEAATLAAGFAGRAAGGAPPADASSAPAASGRRVYLVDRPGSVQSEVRVGHVGVARGSPDYFPLVVMNTILGGAFSSRLNMNLRERQGFTYGASSVFSARRSPGPFVVTTAVQTEVTGGAVREIFREIEAIRESPVTPAELADARNYLAGVFPLTLQTTSGVASRLAELELYGLPHDYFDLYPSGILAVTAEDALRAAREHLHPEAAAVVIVGDAAKIRPELEALGLGPVETIDPATLA